MSIAVRPISPLQHAVPIVDGAGRPTQQFIRQWLEARNITLTADDLSLSIDELSQLMVDLRALSDDLAAQTTTLQGREIATPAAGGLQGGGNLSTNRSLSLANTAVAPGTYGSATKIPVVGVDQKGRITEIAEVDYERVRADAQSANTPITKIISGAGIAFSITDGVLTISVA